MLGPEFSNSNSPPVEPGFYLKEIMGSLVRACP